MMVNKDEKPPYAYNALGQQIYMQDQAGNVIETVYDDAGRMIHKKATTIETGDGFDDAVKRITYAYDDQGRQETITQYDHETPGSGSVVNEVKFTYDGWGNIDTYEQDADSTVATGGDHLYDVSYAYAKATTGRNTLRRTSMTLPDGATVDFAYRSGTLDNDASRVTNMSLTPSGGSVATNIVTYDYLGVGRVVGTDYTEADVMWEQFGSTSGSYPDLDRFNRVTSSRWTKDLSTDIDFVDFDIFYDDNSNITRTEDNIYPAGFDVAYDLDGMNRLTQATEGTWTGSISSKTREELYTLDQVGNFDVFKRDLNGDGAFNGTDEWNDDRTHNIVNELSARDIDDDGTDDYTLVYDAVGNMTDDGQNYEFVYDVWGRLRKITTRGTSPRLVAEYEYYGNNYRASTHYDTDVDGDVDSNDRTYYFAYNERWQMMAVYRDTDSDPKEQFGYHLAGNGGYGGSSYIDQVILRDRDDTNGWTGAADGTLEERIYYCQNWRYDVVALVTDAGELAERARYSPYGVAFGMPLGDVNGDGSVSGADTGIILGDYSSSNWRSDLNLDGTIDSADHTIANNNFGASGGREVLSDIGNRKGYAAYEYAFIGESLYHVRNRVYDAELGQLIFRTFSNMQSAMYSASDDDDDLTYTECETAVEKCFAQDATTKRLINELKECLRKRGKPVPDDFTPPFSCSGHCDGEGGHFIAPWHFPDTSREDWLEYGRMVFCLDNPEGIKSCRTVRHEVTHMLQACRGLLKGGEVPPEDTVERCFKNEREAYCNGDAESGCCMQMRDCFSCCVHICRSCKRKFFDGDNASCEIACGHHFGCIGCN